MSVRLRRPPASMRRPRHTGGPGRAAEAEMLSWPTRVLPGFPATEDSREGAPVRHDPKTPERKVKEWTPPCSWKTWKSGTLPIIG